MSVIPGLERPGQEDHKFEASLRYIASSRPVKALSQKIQKEKTIFLRV
jgi:hypothetical protein